MRWSLFIAALSVTDFLSAQQAAQPYLLRVTDSSAHIHWRSGDSVVQFWQAGGGYKTVVTDGRAGVPMQNLQPLAQHRYQIGNSAATRFKTAPPIGSKSRLQFLAFGDCGTGSVEQKKVLQAMMPFVDTTAFNAILLLGDNAYPKGRDEEYQQRFFDVYADSLLHRFPLYPTPGNHDYMDAKRARRKHNTAYFDIFPSPQKIPYYSVDIGNVHLVSLDSYGKDADGSRLRDTAGIQMQWLKKDLEAYKKSGQQWLIFFWHHPPYSMGTHNSDTEGELRLLRKRVLPIIERYGADVVLCGHSHVYERSHLMAGHYGKQNRFDAAKHVQHNGEGGFYQKNNSGTLYVVSGSAGGRGGHQKTYPHNAMPVANYEQAGALIVDVEGPVLKLRWITEDGRVGDEATLRKN